jgi:hypothetical protein
MANLTDRLPDGIPTAILSSLGGFVGYQLGRRKALQESDFNVPLELLEEINMDPGGKISYSIIGSLIGSVVGIVVEQKFL